MGKKFNFLISVNLLSLSFNINLNSFFRFGFGILIEFCVLSWKFIRKIFK